ncbi:hypothetical protein Tco_1570006 [Tanacetum coccineum]
MNGDAPAIASAITEGPIPPKTAEQKLARKNELKAKSTLLLAIPDEHLLKFHGIKDAKTLWEAIKARIKTIDTDDLVRMDLKWQVAMLTMRGTKEQGMNEMLQERIIPLETPANVIDSSSSSSSNTEDSLEKPKDVRPIAPIIKEWESDSDNDCVIRPSFKQNKPSYAKINFVKLDENTRKSVIEQHTYRQAKNLRKACFDQGIFDSGCSRHMTGNKSYLTDYQDIDVGFVAFAGSPKGGSGPEWLFDIDSLTKSMNINVEKSQTTGDSKYKKEGYANNTNRVSTISPFVSVVGQGFDNANDQERIDSSTQDVNTGGPSINTASESINTGSSNINTASPIHNDLSMQSLEATGIFNDAYDDREEVGAEADLNNLETTMNVNSIPTTRIHKDHLIEKIIRNLHSAPLTRRMSQQNLEELGLARGPLELSGLYRNEKMRRGIVVRNKARLVTQGKKALHGGIHQAPRALYETLSTYLLENGYRRGTIDKTLFIKKDIDDAQEIPDEFYGGAHFLLRIASTTEGGWNLH